MSMTSLAFVVSTVLAVVSLSIQLVGMEEAKRARLATFWKKWTWRALLATLFVLAALGILGFWLRPGAPTRGEILSLVVNVLNLLTVPLIVLLQWILEAAVTQSEKRAKRLDALEAACLRACGLEADSSRGHAQLRLVRRASLP